MKRRKGRGEKEEGKRRVKRGEREKKGIEKKKDVSPGNESSRGRSKL